MDHRLYFVLGDLASNTLTGALVGWLCWLLIGTGDNMWLAMILMMVVGMAAAFLLWVPFGMLFGAMEVMLPLMMTGMTSGMIMSMWVAMHPLSGLGTFLIGAVCGFVTITGIWILNDQVRGKIDWQGERTDG